jgi:YggT family protein
MLIAAILTYVLYAFIVVIFVRVAFSWISPYSADPWSRSNRRGLERYLEPVRRITFATTEPVLGPVRRWIPPVSGIDLSPLVVTLVAYFLIAALRNLG